MCTNTAIGQLSGGRVTTSPCPASAGSLMGDPVVMLSLYPEFPPAVMSSTTKSGEFLFVIDRSGSMQSPMGERGRSQLRIDSAKAWSSCSIQ